MSQREQPLTAPAFPETEEQKREDQWTVVARNERVNRCWEELIAKAPGNSARCYRHLLLAPMTRRPGRVFPLRGGRYRGAWEYEVTGGDRVFYKPNPKERKVVVYYAGSHIQPAPIPPQGL